MLRENAAAMSSVRQESSDGKIHLAARDVAIYVLTIQMVSPDSSNSTASSNATASREKILQAARELFSSSGFDGTSVDQIASLAGVKKPLVFHYFQNKQAILLELMGQLWAGLMENRGRHADEIAGSALPYDQAKVDFRYLAEHRDLVRMCAMEELKDVSRDGDSVFMNRWWNKLQEGMPEFESRGWGWKQDPKTLVSMLLVESLFKWYLSVESAFTAVADLDREDSRRAFLDVSEIVMKALERDVFRTNRGG